MKELIFYPDDRLRVKSEPVKEFGSELNGLIEDMTWTMRNLAGNAVGITAVQCGSPVRMALLEMNWQSKKKGKPVVICNPEVLSAEGMVNHEEGCLSFPGKFIKILRPQIVRIQYQDHQGRTQTNFYHHLMARCILHEIDHFNAVLFIDHVEPEVRENLLRSGYGKS